MSYLKEHDTKTRGENERLTSEVNEFKMQLERLSFEGKEAQITMDGLKEANSELTAELDEVKQQLLDVKMSARETSAVLDEKEKKKAEKMAQMMASFALGGEVFSDNERSIQRAIDQISAFYEQSAAGEAIAPGGLEDLKLRLLETQGIVRQAELSMVGAPSDDTVSQATTRVGTTPTSRGTRLRGIVRTQFKRGRYCGSQRQKFSLEGFASLEV